MKVIKIALAIAACLAILGCGGQDGGKNRKSEAPQKQEEKDARECNSPRNKYDRYFMGPMEI